MRLYYSAGDGESETQAFSQALLSMLDLVERMENCFFVRVFNSRP